LQSSLVQAQHSSALFLFTGWSVMEEGGIISTSGTMLRSVGDKAAGSPGVFSEPGILFLSPPPSFRPLHKVHMFF